MGGDAFSASGAGPAVLITNVDASGGAELVATLATLTGLEAMAELAEPLTRWGYRVHVISPGPVLSLIPPQMA